MAELSYNNQMLILSNRSCKITQLRKKKESIIKKKTVSIIDFISCLDIRIGLCLVKETDLITMQSSISTQYDSSLHIRINIVKI